MKARIVGKKIEPVNSKSNSKIGDVNVNVSSSQTTSDIVDSCITGVVLHYNGNNNSRYIMPKLECLLNLLIPNNTYIDTLTDKIHNELGMVKISKEEIVKCVKDLVYREINSELNKESEKIKQENSKFSNYDILNKMQQMNEEDKLSEKILNNKNINTEKDRRYRNALKKELRKIIDAVIKNEKEKDFENEVKNYTNNYENFVYEYFLDSATKGNCCHSKFSNLEYSMKWKRLLDKLNEFNNISEEKKIEKLLDGKILTISERKILKGRKDVLQKRQVKLRESKIER